MLIMPAAGDQLLRKDMSQAQREQLTELLDDIYDHFLDTVAAARGKTREVRRAGSGAHCKDSIQLLLCRAVMQRPVVVSGLGSMCRGSTRI